MSGSVPRRGGRRVFSGCSEIPMISTVGKQMSTKQGRTREYGFHAKGCNRNSKVERMVFSFLFWDLHRAATPSPWDRKVEEGCLYGPSSGKINVGGRKRAEF